MCLMMLLVSLLNKWLPDVNTNDTAVSRSHLSHSLMLQSAPTRQGWKFVRVCGREAERCETRNKQSDKDNNSVCWSACTAFVLFGLLSRADIAALLRYFGLLEPASFFGFRLGRTGYKCTICVHLR